MVIYQCDRCKIQSQPVSAEQRDVLPRNWMLATVSISAGISRKVSFLLCGNCADGVRNLTPLIDSVAKNIIEQFQKVVITPLPTVEAR